MGFFAQRFYPNESLISFLGANFFRLKQAEKSKLKILEVGCGSGANLWMVAKEGFATFGIDLSASGIGLCKKMLAHWGVTANLQVGTIAKLPYQNNFFDVIFDVVSIQHLTFKQHRFAYEQIFRCLKKGGLFFSYHLGENSISLKSTNNMIDHCTVKNITCGYPLANNGQTCFMSANESRSLLHDVGFVNITIEKITRSYHNQTQTIEYLVVNAEK